MLNSSYGTYGQRLLVGQASFKSSGSQSSVPCSFCNRSCRKDGETPTDSEGLRIQRFQDSVTTDNYFHVGSLHDDNDEVINEDGAAHPPQTFIAKPLHEKHSKLLIWSDLSFQIFDAMPCPNRWLRILQGTGSGALKLGFRVSALTLG